MARDTATPCDRAVVGPLGNARTALLELLTTEAETLVTILGWVEVAMECSLEPNQKQNVRSHCAHALNLISKIEDRHQQDDLPEPVAKTVKKVRCEVEQAIKRLDAA